MKSIETELARYRRKALEVPTDESFEGNNVRQLTNRVVGDVMSSIRVKARRGQYMSDMITIGVKRERFVHEVKASDGDVFALSAFVSRRDTARAAFAESVKAALPGLEVVHLDAYYSPSMTVTDSPCYLPASAGYHVVVRDPQLAEVCSKRSGLLISEVEPAKPAPESAPAPANDSDPRKLLNRLGAWLGRRR